MIISFTIHDSFWQNMKTETECNDRKHFIQMLMHLMFDTQIDVITWDCYQFVKNLVAPTSDSSYSSRFYAFWFFRSFSYWSMSQFIRMKSKRWVLAALKSLLKQMRREKKTNNDFDFEHEMETESHCNWNKFVFIHSLLSTFSNSNTKCLFIEWTRQRLFNFRTHWRTNKCSHTKSQFFSFVRS